MLRIRSLDVSFRTAYAQAKEVALAQAEVPLASAGSLQTEERGGGRFLYRYRYDAAGKRIAEYLGRADSEEAQRRAEAARLEIQDQAILAGYARDLRRLGLCSVDNSTLVTTATLFNAGIFGRGAVLVGTHAFGALLNELGVIASPLPQTEDIDVARAHRIEVAALPRGGMLALLRRTGLPFHEVPALHHGAPSTSYKVRGQKLKVDLLIPSDERPFEPIAVPELGAHATGLPFLRYLIESSAFSMLIGRDRLVPVSVPHAGRFCIHKLAVYSLRTASDNPKRAKDALQAAVLAAVLTTEADMLLDEAIDAMSRSLRTRVKPGARAAMEILSDRYPAAVAAIERLA